MQNVFPKEIINVSVETHFFKFSKNSRLLYIVVLLFFVRAVGSLFLIKIGIWVQSSGIIRSSGESVPVSSPVVAEILKCSISENKRVSKGDTLLLLNCETLDKQISLLKNLVDENQSYIDDISQILKSFSPSIKVLRQSY